MINEFSDHLSITDCDKLQRTLREIIEFQGVGLHSGAPAMMRVLPADADHGIWFKRTDAVIGDRLIPASWDMVHDARLCTLLANDDGVTISTVEHILAALFGCGIQNAMIEVNGGEVPILDGSSAQFVGAILRVGTVEQTSPIDAIRILKPVTVTQGDAWAQFDPADGFFMDFSIEFEDQAIGHQHKVLNLANGTFVRELCDSRTFCRQVDVDAMRSAGLALGGTLENAVVFDGDEILSPGGTRYIDEPVRHKMLDAVGDLSLAGASIIGRFSSYRGGHALTNKLLRALFQDAATHEYVTMDADAVMMLPGFHLTQSDLRAVA